MESMTIESYAVAYRDEFGSGTEVDSEWAGTAWEDYQARGDGEHTDYDDFKDEIDSQYLAELWH